ncbi:MAG TPA: arylesterase [Gammaproteobacteria bacterium]
MRAYRILFFVVALCGMPMANAATKILVLGDSLSAAYNIPLERGWVVLLQQRLSRTYPGTEVINASISGETAANAVRRLPALLVRHTPDVLVIELGGNDGLRGFKLAQIRQSLQSLIDMGKGAGTEIVLAGMQLHPNYGPKFNQQFRELYRQLAVLNKIHLVPLMLQNIGDSLQKMQADATHPTAEAQPEVLENMWPAIEQAIKSVKKEHPAEAQGMQRKKE